MSVGLALFIAGMVGLVAYRIGYLAGYAAGRERGRSEDSREADEWQGT
jgi:hypothetical protein